MSKTREKKVLIQGVGRQEAEDSFADYAKADAEMQGIQAKMDVEVTKIREKYSDRLADLQELKEINFEKLQVYAVSNQADFGKRKSLEMTHGVIGFRTATPSLKTMKGHTWASVLSLCKVYAPSYVRVKEEVSKDLLLSNRDDDSVVSILNTIGVVIAQDESFFVEPKKEEV